MGNIRPYCIRGIQKQIKIFLKGQGHYKRFVDSFQHIIMKINIKGSLLP